MRQNLPITGRSLEVSSEANILSTTNAKGQITYVNSDFVKISGFREDELLGQPHNIVRHPDMPPAAFSHLWETLKQGRSWMGLVKNRCKNGDHYWVSAYVTPMTRNGVVEYQSVRTKPDSEHVQAAEQVYKNLREGGVPSIKWWSSISCRLRIMLQTLGVVCMGTTGVGVLMHLPLFASIISAIVSGLLSALLVFFSLSPLSHLAKKSTLIADNPLSQKLYTGRHDEFGQIEFALRMMQAETGAVVGRIADASKQLDETVAQLLADIELSKSLSVKQQSETDQVASAVNEMTSSIQSVASNTQQAAEAAGNAGGETVLGQRLVTQTSQSITGLEGVLRDAAGVIHELEDQSSEISKVLDVIRGIASQTNLLALNAAIEAARAGEHGRGFAVVADEVRNLAERTQRSTADIQEMISGLQSRTISAVTAMEQSRQQVQSSVINAKDAAIALVGISTRVDEIKSMSAQIAVAVEQQGVVSEDINRSICSIRDKADENVCTAQGNYERASSVAQLSTELNGLARQFWSKKV